jgi:hypothetical protein
MANSFPEMNVTGLKYEITVPGHTIGLASTVPSVLQLVQYTFASAGDYADFDQAAAESTIATALTAVATAWATLLGVDVSLIQAGLEIARVWAFAGPDFVSSPVYYTDHMSYP